MAGGVALRASEGRHEQVKTGIVAEEGMEARANPGAASFGRADCQRGLP